LYGTYSTVITHLLLPTDHPPISEVLRSPVEPAGVKHRPLGRAASGLGDAVDAEGGDEVFVEWEPDAVAGVDVGAIDEGGSPAWARVRAVVNRAS
jgi:hypothetical protein